MVAVKKQGGLKFPVTVNLAEEAFEGSQSDYIKLVKKINQQKGYSWRSLGTISTQVGKAHLSQREVSTQYGPCRQMHAILVKGGRAFLVTATAMESDFTKYYPVFAEIFHSFTVNPAPSIHES